jgi:hypothetical protein
VLTLKLCSHCHVSARRLREVAAQGAIHHRHHKRTVVRALTRFREHSHTATYCTAASMLVPSMPSQRPMAPPRRSHRHCSSVNRQARLFARLQSATTCVEPHTAAARTLTRACPNECDCAHSHSTSIRTHPALENAHCRHVCNRHRDYNCDLRLNAAASALSRQRLRCQSTACGHDLTCFAFQPANLHVVIFINCDLYA